MALTEFGLVVREIRVKLDISLRQMAEALDLSPTYISAVEMDDRALTEDFVHKVVGFLKKRKVQMKEITRLCVAADRTRRTIDVSSLNPQGKAAVAAFARKWADLDRQTREDLLKKIGVTPEEDPE
jgi:transcriptional regulator with XRE-family HTH domain